MADPETIAMFCPTCRVEFGPTYDRCPYCGAALRPPTPAPAEPLELVTVFASRDETLLAVAASLLRAAGMPFLQRGGELVVSAQVADDARLLLAEPAGSEDA